MSRNIVGIKSGKTNHRISRAKITERNTICVKLSIPKRRIATKVKHAEINLQKTS